MREIPDALTLYVRIAHADDNVIFVRNGSEMAPYCAHSVRESPVMLDFLTWTTKQWRSYASAEDYLNSGEIRHDRALLCCGCGRPITEHVGPGRMAPSDKRAQVKVHG